ncbi:unnamed protein product [Schistosoma margrebowiei]|uniref:Uncharacterized protein n=1 Tax=Schistosoma margrebowiei TaxID=48269 RepID=A0A183LTY1_9TREM|nr:unnamed protein product [Schistosoma margrebowiei]
MNDMLLVIYDLLPGQCFNMMNNYFVLFFLEKNWQSIYNNNVEVDEETDIQLDRNLPILDENDEIFTNLINTIAKDFNEMKFTSDNENLKFFDIPVPDEIDIKPIYETVCQLFNNNSKSVLTSLSQSFLMDKSKWILPILKLHTDEDEIMFRKTKTLPSSKLDELFIHEVNKYKKQNEKVENISVNNFNEKYEKILAELKNEEQKFNKLKQKLILCQYKSNEVPLWNTGNDMIVNNDSSDYELLNNCEEKINLLKLNLMNLVNTSPVCSIYKTGKEMYDHKLNSIGNTIQQRFLVVWNKLKFTENEKQYCLLKFCCQHMSDTIYMANINKALKLLEYASEYIERREMLLHKLAKIEIEHLIQSKDYSLNDNHLELKCSDERYKVDKWLAVESRTLFSSYLGLVSWIYLHLRVDVYCGIRTQYHSLQIPSRYLLS